MAVRRARQLATDWAAVGLLAVLRNLRGPVSSPGSWAPFARSFKSRGCGLSKDKTWEKATDRSQTCRGRCAYGVGLGRSPVPGLAEGGGVYKAPPGRDGRTAAISGPRSGPAALKVRECGDGVRPGGKVWYLLISNDRCASRGQPASSRFEIREEMHEKRDWTRQARRRWHPEFEIPEQRTRGSSPMCLFLQPATCNLQPFCSSACMCFTVRGTQTLLRFGRAARPGKAQESVSLTCIPPEGADGSEPNGELCFDPKGGVKQPVLPSSQLAGARLGKGPPIRAESHQSRAGWGQSLHPVFMPFQDAGSNASPLSGIKASFDLSTTYYVRNASRIGKGAAAVRLDGLAAQTKCRVLTRDVMHRPASSCSSLRRQKLWRFSQL
ncbi:hypothetical protein B0T17DRAFT_506289 [Bombardia bombarda]|uniref:Uncharacterized protein n=1 Tax=Bombardia bombarda TaxID=252184 RepID=A0AA40C9R4_9PEZI|nr:hypothetical protein B0T17DRAFT_506289 [Bombardia bombarda]